MPARDSRRIPRALEQRVQPDAGLLKQEGDSVKEIGLNGNKYAQKRKRQELASLALSGCTCSSLDSHRPSAFLMGLRVAPPPASSFAVAGDPVFGLLRLPCPSPLMSSKLRVAPAPRPHERLPAIHQVSLLPRLPANAYGESSGRPEPSLRLRAGLPVSGLPRTLCLPALPAGRSASRPADCALRRRHSASLGCPNSCICGWVDDVSQLNSNFASSGEAEG